MSKDEAGEKKEKTEKDLVAESPINRDAQPSESASSPSPPPSTESSDPLKKSVDEGEEKLEDDAEDSQREKQKKVRERQSKKKRQREHLLEREQEPQVRRRRLAKRPSSSENDAVQGKEKKRKKRARHDGDASTDDSSSSGSSSSSRSSRSASPRPLPLEQEGGEQRGVSPSKKGRSRRNRDITAFDMLVFCFTGCSWERVLILILLMFLFGGTLFGVFTLNRSGPVDGQGKNPWDMSRKGDHDSSSSGHSSDGKHQLGDDFAHQRETDIMAAAYASCGLDKMSHGEIYELVKTFALVTHVDQFILGFQQMSKVCSDLARVLDLHLVAVDANHEGRFKDPLYLASASIYSPYFCLNMPALILTEKADDVLSAWVRKAASDSRQGTEAWKALQHEWNHAVSSRQLVLHTISPTDVFANSALHSRGLQLYFERVFFARDLEQFNRTTTSSSSSPWRMQVMAYDSFSSAALVPNELISPLCICGPHLNMAKHIVLFADRSSGRGRLYVEPVVTQREGDETVVSTSNLPWVTSKDPSIVRYREVDKAFRVTLNYTKLHYNPSVTIDVVKLTRSDPSSSSSPASSGGRSGKPNLLQNFGGRESKRLTGSEATCVQYCQSLAYALKTAVPQHSKLSSAMLLEPDATLSEVEV